MSIVSNRSDIVMPNLDKCHRTHLNESKHVSAQTWLYEIKKECDRIHYYMSVICYVNNMCNAFQFGHIIGV